MHFILKSKISDDIINRIECDDYDFAVDYFSSIKDLNKSDFLELFIVEVE